MESLWREVFLAVRSLTRAPSFTVAAVVTLGLGIGANSAFFSVLDGVVLRPLPFPDPGRFVHLRWDRGPGAYGALTALQYEYWRDNTHAFDAVATYHSFLGRVDAGDHVDGVTSLRVTHGFMDVLGFKPAMGRDFTAVDDVPGGSRVAMVSKHVWQNYLDGTPDVVGRALRVNEEQYTVVGVLPEDFAFPHISEPVGIMVPMGLRADPSDAGENFDVIARLREGVSLAMANDDVGRLLPPFAGQYPDQVYGDPPSIVVSDYTEAVVGDLAGALWMTMGSVFLVLLIACANVANLILARSAGRRREMALRSALGASRARIARLVLVEGVILALAAGALGLVLAQWGVRLVPLSPAALPRMGGIGVDWRVVTFTFLTTLATGVLFGGVGAWPALRADLAETMKDGARGTSRRGLGRQGLLAVQACFSMILLVGSGLFLASLQALRHVPAGFEPDGVTAVRFPFKPQGYGTSEALWAFEREVLEELRRDGAVSAASASNLPLVRGLNIPVTIGGRPDDYEGAVQWRAVSPGYFETLGIRTVTGRDFDAGDEAGAPPVAIVNEAFVRRYFPDTNPIGQRVEVGRFRGGYLRPELEGPGAEIVAVVVDVREVSLRAEASRTVFVPAAQAPSVLATAMGQMPTFMIRGGTGATARFGEGELRSLLRRVDPGLPDADIVSLDRVVSESLAQERFASALFSSFAGLALVLTAMGIYGVLSYTVRQRRKEIGVRMALGAGSAKIMGLVGRQGMIPVAVGLAAGLAASLGLSRLLADVLWGVSPTDPVTLAAVASVLLGVALAAAWLPAREALKVDPVKSLGSE